MGSLYFKSEKKIENVQLSPVFCPKNDNHDDDFIGIHYQGYQTRGNGKLVEGIMYPAKNFTAEDKERLFDKIDTKEGTVYRAKSNLSLDEVFIRVCYKTPGTPNPDKDNIKWVAAVDGGEVFALHGDRRKYVVKETKDAEA